MQNNLKTLESIIKESKKKTYLSVIFSSITFLILLFLFFKRDIFYIIFFTTVIFIVTIPKVTAYKNILKIRDYLITRKMLEKIGEIKFWDSNRYLLTDNFMMIIEKEEVLCFPYKEIKKMFKKSKFKIGKNSSFQRYLHIVLKNNKEIKILIFSTTLVNENYKDITEYILSKNKNIELSK